MRTLIVFTLFFIVNNVIAEGVATVLSTYNKVTNTANRVLSKGSSLTVGDAIITAAVAKARIK